MKHIQTLDIRDPVYDETYTAHMKKKGTGWIGWIPEVPEVKCKENTQDALLKTLVKTLHEALAAEQEAWEKQFEADVKAGHLDRLSEKAIKSFRQGKYYEVEKLQELIKK